MRLALCVVAICGKTLCGKVCMWHGVYAAMRVCAQACMQLDVMRLGAYAWLLLAHCGIGGAISLRRTTVLAHRCVIIIRLWIGLVLYQH